MIEFELGLVEDIDRPVIVSSHTLTALVDTGASISVWTGDLDILINELHAVVIRNDVELSGFGGSEQSIAYKIPSLTISNITFKNVPIVVSTKLGDVPFNIILSAPMFSGMVYQFDTINSKMRIYIPDNKTERVFKIKKNNGKYYAFVTFDIDKYKEKEILESKIEIINKDDSHKSFASSLKNHSDNTYGDE